MLKTHPSVRVPPKKTRLFFVETWNGSLPTGDQAFIVRITDRHALIRTTILTWPIFERYLSGNPAKQRMEPQNEALFQSGDN